MKHHSWSDIKAQATAEVRASIEGEARRLSESIRVEAEDGASAPDLQANSSAVENVSDKHSDHN